MENNRLLKQTLLLALEYLVVGDLEKACRSIDNYFT